jgi:hypothetical protein
MAQGGTREAAIRALVYMGMASGAADERAFAVLKQLRAEQGQGVTLAEFKALVREQFFMLLIDENQALRTLPDLVARDPGRADEILDVLRRVATAPGPLADTQAERMTRIEQLLGVTPAVTLVTAGDARKRRTQRSEIGEEAAATTQPANTTTTE